MNDKNSDLDCIGVMIANGQNLGACMKELRSFERRVKELKSRVAVQAAAAKSVSSSGKKQAVEWPATACLLQEEALRGDHFDHVNMLRFFDYRVGKSGRETPERQRILKYLFFWGNSRV